ncbi:MAG: hypothetical protein ACT4QF_21860 [Sporichthyaceae bacterium]|jgi:hypothetical protein
MSPDATRTRFAVRLALAGVVLSVAGAIFGLALSAVGALLVAGAALVGLARFAHRSGPAPVRRLEGQFVGV